MNPSLFVQIPRNETVCEIALTAMREWRIDIARRIEFTAEAITQELKLNGDAPANLGDNRAELKVLVSHLEELDRAAAKLQAEINQEVTDE